ncbi:hypothetical protein D3C76_1132850 [compost metagenome]
MIGAEGKCFVFTAIVSIVKKHLTVPFEVIGPAKEHTHLTRFIRSAACILQRFPYSLIQKSELGRHHFGFTGSIVKEPCVKLINAVGTSFCLDVTR